MRSFIVGRVVQYVFVLGVASVVIFVLSRSTPVDPVSVILGGRQASPHTVADLRARFWLDRPMAVQYLHWIGGILHGDLGVSYRYHLPVALLIARRLPTTLGIVGLSLMITTVVAVPSGVLAALHPRGFVHAAFSAVQLVLAACPTFLIGMLMVWFVTAHAPGISFIGGYDGWNDYLRHITLPALALACSMIALTARMTARGVSERFDGEYGMAARSRGVSRRRLAWVHCLRGAAVPVVTVMGLQFGMLLVGSSLVETVFSLPGLGTLLVEAVTGGDYGLVQALTLLMVAVFMTVSLLLDVTCRLLDPRLRAQAVMA